MSLKVYGVPLSQPFRSVAWTLLMKHVPFEVQLTVPGATSRIGSLNETYLQKTKGRTGKIPMLEDDVTAITESPAILMYLCEKHGWHDLYGLPGTPEKALMDSYMHWHHTGTRALARVAMPYLRPELNLQVTASEKVRAATVLESLDTAWLQGDDLFIASPSTPTIADILAYEEVMQVYMTSTFEGIDEEYPKVAAWMNRMKELPYHKEAHTALDVLGNLVEPNEKPIQKRLAAATKAGLAAIKDAQVSFPQSNL